MAGVLSLNGEFTYPVELLKTLTVDDKSIFKSGVVICDSDTSTSSENSISIGNGNIVQGLNSIAVGNNISVGTNIENVVAAGIDVIANNNNSFVWSGCANNVEYQSAGDGSFCIKPKASNNRDCEYGFYIGDKEFPELISTYSCSAVSGFDNEFTGDNIFNGDITSMKGDINIKGGTFNIHSGVNTTFGSGVSITGGMLNVNKNVNSCFGGNITVTGNGLITVENNVTSNISGNVNILGKTDCQGGLTITNGNFNIEQPVKTIFSGDVIAPFVSSYNFNTSGQVANLRYVEERFVKKTGDVMSGSIVVSGNVSPFIKTLGSTDELAFTVGTDYDNGSGIKFHSKNHSKNQGGEIYLDAYDKNGNHTRMLMNGQGHVNLTTNNKTTENVIRCPAAERIAFMTEADYNALETKDSGTIYMLTEEWP